MVCPIPYRPTIINSVVAEQLRRTDEKEYSVYVQVIDAYVNASWLCVKSDHAEKNAKRRGALMFSVGLS